MSNLSNLQKKVWSGSIPLEIRLASSECRTFDQSDPYLILSPRLAYLPFLLPRLHAFFTPYLIDPSGPSSEGWLSYQDVPLKWHYPLGVLYDLYSGAEPAQGTGLGGKASGVDIEGKDGDRDGDEDEDGEAAQPLPWRLTVHFTDWPIESLSKLDEEGRVLHDAFINGVKEADFLRNGTAKAVMSLSKDDSTQLWTAVQTHSLPAYNAINNKLLNPPGASLRHVPMKLYLPHAANGKEAAAAGIAPGSLRVVQALVTPKLQSRHPQTLGTALNAIIPSLFPSRRSPLLAQPVLHGAVVPMAANVEELMRAAAYADGWLHIVIVMMG
ncbi:autophagy protein-like protein 5 [Lepidopterella palustris CBS 459.81]|uniref:Autophagy protein 5 n=1 Tax=Lepidopterella palustris CBS 459.81 TaxID=1314670 RepID=A0A8E2JH99_9PEZI|nr:autophagy protein-like protein 5 [Lepidopterella palustris CBS 459.81]